jgi:uncharacterized YigZ family protein
VWDLESHKSGGKQSSSVTGTYRTVAGSGRSRFEIRGSEFVGHVERADSVDRAESIVASIREEYADATHNVPAYRVRADPLREWASDDGEPGGSAGDPALNVLVQEDVENVVAVVTRYYGGTNLGVGGLARAYSRGVKEALDDAGVTERRPHEEFTVTTAYDDSGTVRGVLESAGVEFDATYEADVQFVVRTPVGEAASLRDRLRSATGDRVTVERD